MTRFADPVFLLLLLVIIPLMIIRQDSGGRIRFSSIDGLKTLMKNRSLWHPRKVLLVLRILVVIALVAGLARPQAGKKFTEVDSEGVDIMLALDTSGSMRAMDFLIEGKRQERLDVVKSVVNDFIKKRPSDRMGMVVFGTDAYTQCPLTLDHGILISFLGKVEIGMAGDTTAIGSAIGTAVKRMKDLKSKSKVVILLTDGSNNAGDLSPLKAAEIAATMGIKIYTIGVGTKGKAPFLVDSLFGKSFVYQEVDLDEETLSKIAVMTKAKYYRATDTEQLNSIYNEIDGLEKTEQKVKEYTEYNELFHWFVLAGLLIFVLEMVLAGTRLRKLP